MSSEKTNRKIKISRGNIAYIIAVILMLGLCLAAFLSAMNTGFCDWWKLKVFTPYTDCMIGLTSGTDWVLGHVLALILLSLFVGVVLVLILRVLFRTDSYRHFGNVCLKSVLIVLLSIVLLWEAVWYIPRNATFLSGSYTGTDPVTRDILEEYYDYLKEEVERNKELLDWDYMENVVFPDRYDWVEDVQSSASDLSYEFTYLNGKYPQVKTIPVNRGTSTVCAYTLPLTAEVVMESDLSGMGMITMYAHELAHNKGYLREEEAQFVAWKICLESKNPYVRHCALMLAMDLVEFSHVQSGYTLDTYEHTLNDIDTAAHDTLFFESPLTWGTWSFMGGDIADSINETRKIDEELGWKLERKISGDEVYEKLMRLMIEDYRRSKAK
ncbi:MAG: DUF3810 family protein [Clostridiales bacterium]|nr:DUF3810 family protein [Clostridiales bacterium]